MLKTKIFMIYKQNLNIYKFFFETLCIVSLKGLFSIKIAT